MSFMSVLQIADAILEGRIHVHRHGEVELGQPVDWQRFAREDRNLEFRLQDFRWTEPLLEAAEQTGEQKYLAAWDAVFDAWCDRHGDYRRLSLFRWHGRLRAAVARAISDALEQLGFPNVFSRKTYGAWYDHAVGLRALILARRIRLGGADGRLRDVAGAHLRLLKRESFFQKRTNHGVNQLRGLLALGLALDDTSATDLVRRRFENYVRGCIDDYGVVHEQSTQYQRYGQKTISALLRDATGAGMTLSRDVENRIVCMDWLIWCASSPDGGDVMIGDSERHPPRDHRKLWPVPPPSVPPAHQVLEDHRIRGDHFPGRSLFVRDREEPGRRGRHGFHLSLTLQPRRRIHGHEDCGAVNLYLSGRQVVLPAGKFRYAPESTPERAYVLGRAGQNGVVPAAGGSPRFRACKVEHLALEDSTARIRLRMEAPGLEWVREFEAAPADNRLTVIDRYPGTFYTQYRLPPEAEVSCSAAGIRANLPGHGVLSFEPGAGFATTASIHRGETDPVLGWYSPNYGKWVECPVVRLLWRDRACSVITLTQAG